MGIYFGDSLKRKKERKKDTFHTDLNSCYKRGANMFISVYISIPKVKASFSTVVSCDWFNKKVCLIWYYNKKNDE